MRKIKTVGNSCLPACLVLIPARSLVVQLPASLRLVVDQSLEKDDVPKHYHTVLVE